MSVVSALTVVLLAVSSVAGYADLRTIMRPDDILINMTVQGSDLCSTSGGDAIMKSGNVINFPSGKSVDILTACKNTQVIQNCSLVEVAMQCNENDANLTVIVSTSYTEDLNQALVKGDRLVQLMVDKFNVTSDASATYSVRPEGCRSGTLGVYDVKLGALCRGCSLGHYLSTLTNSCQPCPPGHYADSPLSVQCKICPALANDLNSTVWQEVNRTSAWRSYGIFMCPRPGLMASLTTGHNPLKGHGPQRSTNSGPATSVVNVPRLDAAILFFILHTICYQR
ncbi:hypothetical protein Btru_055933 [Bulinus truncatus]|nr:hypothetical protein Btru_055933 [Bulinus truncatus]